MTLQYLDFDLEIGEGSGRDYRVSARSLAGEARATMHFPYDELALESRLKDLQIALLRSGGTRRKILVPEQEAVRDFGQALFDALFSGEVRSRYDVSLQQAKSQGKGLRIRLSCQSPLAAALPWEYLFDPRQAEYCSLSVATPLIRYLELSQPVAPLAVTPPLRILGMVSSPSGLPALDVDQEKQRIEQATQALRKAGRIELQWVQGQTWRDLQTALRQGPWHIFHFSGHGRFDPTTDEGQVVFADDHGEAQLLQASDAGRLLANHRTLRVAWLNACEGARGSKLDVFSSTASILVRRGIPAVVAMQYEITDRVAIELARTFYETLADGYPVDAALAEARVAVSVAVNNTVEWGTPVLYMQSPDGRIFDLPAWIVPSRSRERIRPQAGPKQRAEPRGPQPAPKPEPDRPEPSPRRAPPPDLDERYIQALEYFWTERWLEANALLGEIIAQQPDYPGAAAKLEQAQRQQTLVTRYAEAVKAYDAAHWAAAIEHLEAVVALDPGYEDAAARLAEAKQQQVLAELYAEARRLFDARAWQAVVKVFDRIREQDAAYPDPQGVLQAASESLAAQHRERKLAGLYGQAVRDIDAGRLDEARLGFEEVIQLSPDYKQADVLLARVRTAIAKRDAETQRQARLAELSGRASDLIAARDWDGADNALIELREAGASQAEVAAQLAEVKRQRSLEALYRQGLAYFQAQDWSAAAAALEEIVQADPAYAPPELEQASALLARVRQAEQEADRRAQEQHAAMLESLHREAEERLVSRDWQRAIELLTQIGEADPGASDVASKLAAVRRQQDLAEQFAAARAHIQAGRWQEAIAAFQAFVHVEPDYTDPTWGKASDLLLQASIEQARSVQMETEKPAERASRKAPEQLSPAIPAQPFQQEPVDMLTITVPIRLVLVRVSASEFLMGTQPEDLPKLVRDFGGRQEWFKNETPQQHLDLPEFYIGKFAVTVEQFDAFVKATGYQTDAEREGFGWVRTGSGWKQEHGASWKHPKGPESDVARKGDHPVTQVTWQDALAFCSWLKMRLPTEAEWEKAARGDDGRFYPWGNQIPNQKLCNFGNKIADTSPVGGYLDGVSPYGVHDMAGNVWEWCSSKYKDYPYRVGDGREILTESSPRVLRGGSFLNDSSHVRCVVRDVNLPYYRFDNFGFRVCAEIQQD